MCKSENLSTSHVYPEDALKIEYRIPDDKREMLKVPVKKEEPTPSKTETIEEGAVLVRDTNLEQLFNKVFRGR